MLDASEVIKIKSEIDRRIKENLSIEAKNNNLLEELSDICKLSELDSYIENLQREQVILNKDIEERITRIKEQLK
jgi:hypothetical protein